MASEIGVVGSASRRRERAARRGERPLGGRLEEANDDAAVREALDVAAEPASDEGRVVGDAGRLAHDDDGGEPRLRPGDARRGHWRLRLRRGEVSAGVVRVGLRERLRQGHRVAKAVVGLLRHGLRDDRVEVAGDLRTLAPDVRRLLEEHLREHANEIVTAVRRLPRETAVEHAAEGELIGAGIDVQQSARLLGRDVARRADEQPLLRHRGRSVAETRHAEVDEDGVVVALGREEDVGRLHVAVDDPRRVSLGERLREPSAHLHRRSRGQLAEAPHARGERLAFDPAHRQEGAVVPRVAVRDVTDDARVLEAREHLGFAQEALAHVARGCVQHLDRDGLARLAIERAVDGGHATAPALTDDLEPIRDEGAGLHRSSR